MNNINVLKFPNQTNTEKSFKNNEESIKRSKFTVNSLFHLFEKHDLSYDIYTRMVHFLLTLYSERDGGCKVTIQRISHVLGISERLVKRCVSVLKESGEISVVSGVKRINTYSITPKLIPHVPVITLYHINELIERIENSDLKFYQRALLIFFGMKMNGGRCWHTQSEIAQILGSKEDTIQRHLKALEEEGAITSYYSNIDGKRNCKEYRFARHYDQFNRTNGICNHSIKLNEDEFIEAKKIVNAYSVQNITKLPGYSAPFNEQTTRIICPHNLGINNLTSVSVSNISNKLQINDSFTTKRVGVGSSTQHPTPFLKEKESQNAIADYILEAMLKRFGKVFLARWYKDNSIDKTRVRDFHDDALIGLYRSELYRIDSKKLTQMAAKAIIDDHDKYRLSQGKSLSPIFVSKFKEYFKDKTPKITLKVESKQIKYQPKLPFGKKINELVEELHQRQYQLSGWNKSQNIKSQLEEIVSKIRNNIENYTKTYIELNGNTSSEDMAYIEKVNNYISAYFNMNC